MDAQVPLVMALDDPGAVPEVVGGKGASLARLARAGFRVPPGFYVTTGAYLDFVERGGLREQVLAAVSAVDVSDAATFEVAPPRASASCSPASLACRDGGSYRRGLRRARRRCAGRGAVLGDGGGPSRHVGCRAARHVPQHPRRGGGARRGPAVLGVAVVGAGHRLPRSPWHRAGRGEHRRRRAAARAGGGGRRHVHHRPGRRRARPGRHQRELGSRRVRRGRRRHPGRRGRRPGVGDARQLPAGQQGGDDRGRRHGHRSGDTPADLRSAPVLSPAQASELARVGLAIEKLYGEPVDVEWARADGELSVVQARPITARCRSPGRRARRAVERQPGRGLPVDQRQPRRGPARRHDARHLVLHRAVHVADDLPAEPARLPRLRADRRALLREREHVDVARGAGRHLAAPVRRAASARSWASSRRSRRSRVRGFLAGRPSG